MSVELCGVRFYFGFSFVAVVTLMLLCADAEIALISLFSSAAHETGHLACLFLFGEKPRSVELGAFGMRITCVNERALSYSRDAVFTLAGPAVNAAVAAVSAAAAYKTGSYEAKLVFAVNALVGGFNLLPFYCLDGGRAVYLFACERLTVHGAQRLVSVTSNLTVAFLAVFGVYLYLSRSISISFAAAVAYLFILLWYARKKSDKGS